MRGDRRSRARWGVAVVCGAILSGAFAAIGHADAARDLRLWAEGRSYRDGATRDFYNRAAKLRWQNHMGDWLDADGVAQGESPLAAAEEIDHATVEFDLSDLVRLWRRQPETNRGILLKTLAGGAIVNFHSREAKRPELRPRLEVITDSDRLLLAPAADTYLERSSFKSRGTARLLRLSGSKNHSLLYFDLAGIAPGSSIRQARLRLHVAKRYGKRPLRIGVYRAWPAHPAGAESPRAGLAANYLQDQGLAADPDVLFFSDFDDDGWLRHFTKPTGYFDRFSRPGGEEGFVPLDGEALRVRLPKGKNLGINTAYLFAEQQGAEPEAIYFRYYLRLGDNWRTVEGGKLPGIAGTYNTAGWGGRAVNGANGWSARGLFDATIGKGNIAAGLVPTGSYVYQPDAKSKYGSHWYWDRRRLGVLERNRWYCVEHYVQLNTPGQRDGVLRGWVDGQLAFEREDIRFRDIPTLKVDRIWLNVYHGGVKPAVEDAALFIDNLVIARRYIGPMGPLTDAAAAGP